MSVPARPDNVTDRRARNFLAAAERTRELALRANAAKLSSAERKVVTAVISLTMTWCRIADRVFVAQVAEIADLSDRVTRAALKSLAERGLIEWEPSRSPSGSWLGLVPVDNSSLRTPGGAESAEGDFAPPEVRRLRTPGGADTKKTSKKNPPRAREAAVAAVPPRGGEDDHHEEHLDPVQQALLLPLAGGRGFDGEAIRRGRAGAGLSVVGWDDDRLASAVADVERVHGANREEALAVLRLAGLDPQTAWPGRVATSYGGELLKRERARVRARRADEIDRMQSRYVLEDLRAAQATAVPVAQGANLVRDVLSRARQSATA